MSTKSRSQFVQGHLTRTREMVAPVRGVYSRCVPMRATHKRHGWHASSLRVLFQTRRDQQVKLSSERTEEESREQNRGQGEEEGEENSLVYPLRKSRERTSRGKPKSMAWGSHPFFLLLLDKTKTADVSWSSSHPDAFSHLFSSPRLSPSPPVPSSATHQVPVRNNSSS